MTNIDPDIAAVRGYVQNRGYTSDEEGWAIEVKNGPVLAALNRVEVRLEAAEKALSLVYRYDSVATAESCDEADKTGALLGRVRVRVLNGELAS